MPTLARLCLIASLAWLHARAAALAPRGFSFSGISNRTITPNGDGKNDSATFTCDDPSASEVTGRIFDLKGALIVKLDSPADPSLLCRLTWDGKAAGRIVPSGVYIYAIESEGKIYRGTVIVIR